eukprot:8863926-Pyramimonas_sp.AAC.1
MNDEFEGWCGIREAVELPEVSQVKEVLECVVDQPGTDNKWIIQRLGPLKGLKADEWQQLGWHFNGALRASPDKPLPVAGNRHALAEAAGWRTFALPRAIMAVWQHTNYV